MTPVRITVLFVVLIRILDFFFYLQFSSLPCVDPSYMQSNHCYVHILSSYTITPCFYLSIGHLLFAKPLIISDLDIDSPSSGSIYPKCSCLYYNIRLAYNPFVMLTCDCSSYFGNIFFSS